MKIKAYYLLGSLCLLAAALYMLNRQMGPLFAKVARPNDETRRGAVESLYKVSFHFSDGSPKLAAFLPLYEEVPYAAAVSQAARFGLSSAGAEEDAGWTFVGAGKSLFVHSNMQRLLYEDDRQGDADMTEQQALLAAESFVRAKNLPLTYTDATARWEGDRCIVQFIGKIGALPDYAFPVTATVQGGAVVALDYTSPAYERLAPCAVRTMREAYYALPVDDTKDKIDLTRCTLVYRYAESIIQPAYLFEGTRANGEPYRTFVPAAIFGKR